MRKAILSLALLALKATAAVNLTALYAGLSPAAEIIYTTDTDFTNGTTPRYTIYRPPRSYGTIIPATEADIQHLVRTSVDNNIPFLATGAGHGITKTLGGFHFTNTGIIIDLSNFNTVELSPDNESITVGGGATYGDAYEPMYNAGKMMTMGNSPCVGIVGAGLGGAVGMWQGLYGLGIDSLLSVRMVTAAGELVSVSATENPDLFWAIRGAGANFGIVTDATFRLHDVFNGGDVAMSFFRYHADRNGSVWRALRGFDDDMPDLLAFNIAMSIDPDSREPFIAVQANYYGPASEAAPYIQPFHAAAPFDVQEMVFSWPELQSYTHTVDPRNCAPGQYMNEWSISLRQTDVDTYIEYYNQLHALWASEERYTGQTVIARFPNRVAREVGDDETAYPHRRAISHLYKTSIWDMVGGLMDSRLFENFYSDPALDESINAWMPDVMGLFQGTSGFDELHVYGNFAQGNEGPEAWYGSNLDRLKELKRIWDPNGLFNYNNPIPV